MSSFARRKVTVADFTSKVMVLPVRVFTKICILLIKAGSGKVEGDAKQSNIRGQSELKANNHLKESHSASVSPARAKKSMMNH